MKQSILHGAGNLPRTLALLNSKRAMLVCDSSFEFLPSAVRSVFTDRRDSFVRFDSFKSNPLYEDVAKGVSLFRDSGCDAIVAVGGGSTIDVAKCIKLFCKMQPDTLYLSQEYMDSGVPLIALPTTAGTGSESTRFAVIYYEGKKQSVAHESIIPNYALLEPSVLKTLPIYQKKCTLLDALCQGIESWWSINSTDESKKFAKNAISTIVRYMDDYFNGSTVAAEQIMLAANYAGRAINITQTTAPHAMSYKLTSLYRLPHGHAVALCLPPLWEYMLENKNEQLQSTFFDIAAALGCDSPSSAVSKFRRLTEQLGLRRPTTVDFQADIQLLTESVNPERLKNNPLIPNPTAIAKMYEEILINEG